MIKDSFAKIWNLATEEIAEIYELGTFDFLEKKNPELYRKINSAEDNVNLFWDKDPNAFRMSVDLWKNLMCQAIEEFSHDRIQTMGAKMAASEAAPESQVEKELLEKRPLNIFERIKETRGENE